MNRRSFLGSLIASPFTGSIVNAITINNPIEVNKLARDKFVIFTPEEISQHWKYVKLPVFEEGGKQYVVKTNHLHFGLYDKYIDGDKIEWFFKEFKHGVKEKYTDLMCQNDGLRELIQMIAKREINRNEFTHIHSVEFYRSPTLNDGNSLMFYGAFFRGAKVK